MLDIMEFTRQFLPKKKKKKKKKWFKKIPNFSFIYFMSYKFTKTTQKLYILELIRCSYK